MAAGFARFSANLRASLCVNIDSDEILLRRSVDARRPELAHNRECSAEVRAKAKDREVVVKRGPLESQAAHLLRSWCGPLSRNPGLCRKSRFAMQPPNPQA